MTPADLVVMLANGLGVILPWVGAGIGGGVLLFFVFLGIRKGFEFFGSLVNDRQADAYFNSAQFAADEAEEDIWTAAHDAQVDAAERLGWSIDDQFASARVAGDLAVMEHKGEI